MAVIVETLCAEDLELGTGDTTKTHPAGGTLNGHQISLSSLSLAGPGGNATKLTVGADNVITTQSTAQVTVTVPGAALGDMVLAACDGIATKTLLFSAVVSALNTVTITIYNPSSNPITLTAGHIWTVLVFRCR
jgi:hypothetical protein